MALWLKHVGPKCEVAQWILLSELERSLYKRVAVCGAYATERLLRTIREEKGELRPYPPSNYVESMV